MTGSQQRNPMRDLAGQLRRIELKLDVLIENAGLTEQVAAAEAEAREARASRTAADAERTSRGRRPR